MKANRLAIDDPKWTSFVESHGEATVFHSVAWSQLLAECYGYQSFVVAAKDARGEVLAGIPMMEIRSWLTGRRWVSLPFTDFCPPLYRDKQSLEVLLDYLERLKSEHSLNRIEIRGQMPQRATVHASSLYVIHKLNLSEGSEAVLESVSKMHRRNIKRAKREGVIVEESQLKEAMDVFYRLQVSTRRRHGLPVQPKRFFDLVWERLIDKDLGFMLLAYKDNLPEAGGVFLKGKDVLIYKYGASTERGRKTRANNLLFWTAIQRACEWGYKLIDLGRTNIRNEGLRDFKSGWAAEEMLLEYSVIADRQPVQSKDAVKPLFGRIIRYSPSFVCRATGEWLYGHFG